MPMHSVDQFATLRSVYRRLTSAPSDFERLATRIEAQLSSRIPKRVSSSLTSATTYLAARPFLAFLLFYALICTRAFHWLSNPQFFIEDGPEFYGPAFNYGLSTLTREYASYFHAVHRILALIALLFPLRYGPLVMELLALGVEAGTAALILSKRMAGQFASSNVRFSLAFFLIAHPYSDELFGNVAHAQWYLAVVSLAIVYAEPCKKTALRIVDSILITLNCLTGPYAPIVAASAWIRTRTEKRILPIAILTTLTAVITVVEILNHPRTGLAKIHRFALLERMIANQVVSGPLLGLNSIRRTPMTVYFDPQMSAIALFGALVIGFGLRKSPPLIRAIAGLGVFSSMSSLISQATWFGLGNPGMGERYFFYLGMVFVYCVYVLSATATFATVRWFFRWFLACSAWAILTNWVYDPPDPTWNFAPQISRYDRLKPGEKLLIRTPCNRSYTKVKWEMWLIKK